MSVEEKLTIEELEELMNMNIPIYIKRGGKVKQVESAERT